MMFGAVEGIRAFQKDRAELADLAARRQLMEAQTDTERARPGLLEREMRLEESREQSIAKFREAQAKQMAAKAEADAETLRILRSGETPPPGSPPPTLEQAMATIEGQAAKLARAGMPNEAAEVAGKAAQVYQRMASAKAAEEREAASLASKQLQIFETVQKLFGNVKNEMDHAQAVMAYEGLPFAKEFPLDERIRDYNPRAIAALTAGATKKADEIKNELAERRVRVAEENARGLAAYRRARLSQIERRNEDLARAAERKTKVEGGKPEKPIRGPQAQEVKQTLAELERQGLLVGDAAEKQSQARMIMSDALELHQRMPGLSLEEARQRAIEDAKTRGEIEPGSMLNILGKGPMRNKFSPKPGSASRPIDATSIKSPADLKPGSYYRAKDGSLVQWTGSALVPIGERKGVVAPPPNVLDDEFDDEGDDE